jgi:hypothetical protein
VDATVFEPPDRASVLLPDPIDCAPSERVPGECGERDPAGRVTEAELPTFTEEELLEVLQVVVIEGESGSLGNCTDESFAIVNVEKR